MGNLENLRVGDKVRAAQRIHMKWNKTRDVLIRAGGPTKVGITVEHGDVGIVATAQTSAAHRHAAARDGGNSESPAMSVVMVKDLPGALGLRAHACMRRQTYVQHAGQLERHKTGARRILYTRQLCPMRRH